MRTFFAATNVVMKKGLYPQRIRVHGHFTGSLKRRLQTGSLIFNVRSTPVACGSARKDDPNISSVVIIEVDLAIPWHGFGASRRLKTPLLLLHIQTVLRIARSDLADEPAGLAVCFLH